MRAHVWSTGGVHYAVAQSLACQKIGYVMNAMQEGTEKRQRVFEKLTRVICSWKSENYELS